MDAEALLVRAGWFTGRRVDVADDEGSLWAGFDEEFSTLADSVEKLVDAVLVPPERVRLNRRVD